MNNERIGLPELAKQTANVTKELFVRRLRIRPSALTLVGLRAAFKGHFPIQDNPNIDFYVNMAQFQARTNDLLDIIPIAAESKDLPSGSFGAVRTHYESIQRERRAALKRLREPLEGYEVKRAVVNNYMAEIALINRDGRKKSEGTYYQGNIIAYRALENAVSLVNLSAIVLDHSELKARVLPKIEKRTTQAVKEKYSWILESNPETDMERKLCALFNIVMGLQCCDDVHDLEQDLRLGLDTIATETLKMHSGDERKTRRTVAKIRDKYYERARGLGATKAATSAINSTYKLVKLIMDAFPRRFGAPREKLLAELKIVEGLS